MLAWHHLFDDYPSAGLFPIPQPGFDQSRDLVCPRQRTGIIWIKLLGKIPFGANNMGMGYPTMGILAGQFAF